MHIHRLLQDKGRRRRSRRPFSWRLPPRLPFAENAARPLDDHLFRFLAQQQGHRIIVTAVTAGAQHAVHCDMQGNPADQLDRAGDKIAALNHHHAFFFLRSLNRCVDRGRVQRSAVADRAIVANIKDRFVGYGRLKVDIILIGNTGQELPRQRRQDPRVLRRLNGKSHQEQTADQLDRRLAQVFTFWHACLLARTLGSSTHSSPAVRLSVFAASYFLLQMPRPWFERITLRPNGEDATRSR
ncbi:MAG: hypothetical protein BWY83_03140 [bacterium ADurb.Bin478]|nr:MAG: hypothetical protein BWY83_03140 [bacterium ADurb.Bin478]